MMLRGFIILDFGSQVTMLIARRLRELGYFSEILSYKESMAVIKEKNPYGVILSGGPYSVYDTGSPTRNVKELLDLYPVLGICYGMQLIAHQMGGTVTKSDHREYGIKDITWTKTIDQRIPMTHQVWMSHGDIVEKIPLNAETLCVSDKHCAGFINRASAQNQFMAFQFHPEVTHSHYGTEMLKYFCEQAAGAPNWNAKSTFEAAQDYIQNTVGPSDHVLCALSGGVDSSVVATLLTKTLGADRVHCVFLDNGLLRHQEFENVLEQYKQMGLNVHGIDAKSAFLTALKGKSEPEEKRKTIGRTFIEVFDAVIQTNLSGLKDKIKFLAQGTLYPDVIESISSVGGSVTIKSHHNVGGLPEKMNLKLVEPVRHLFKDEVRKLGLELGLDKQMIGRHPFPGPGLAIRVIGEVTESKLAILKKADHIFIENLRKHGLYDKIWQAFCALLPVQTVGVMGDGRTYDFVLALRAVTSIDGMTADWYSFETDFLRSVSAEIVNSVKGINRVVYDITSKPPATIEWE